MKIKKVDELWLVLKIVYGFYVLIAGINKFFPILATGDATQLISPWIMALLPISAERFLTLIGVFEIINALLIFSAFTYQGAYMLMAWVLIIAFNLATMNAQYSIILNLICVAASCYVLAQLSLARLQYAKK